MKKNTWAWIFLLALTALAPVTVILAFIVVPREFAFYRELVSLDAPVKVLNKYHASWVLPNTIALGIGIVAFVCGVLCLWLIRKK